MVLRSVREGCKTSVGMVVGLTNADSSILERIPDTPLLIPGLGAQGGDLSCLSGSGHVAPPLINVSRGIMYQNPELGFCREGRRICSAHSRGIELLMFMYFLQITK